MVTPRKILIVDDDEDGAASVGVLLDVWRHEVAVRFDGQSALECVEDLRPDIAFLDLSMPELDGYELCRRIRSKPWGNEPYLFAVTGWTHVESEALSAGFDGCLLKPYSLADLEALLANPAARSKRVHGERRGPAAPAPGWQRREGIALGLQGSRPVSRRRGRHIEIQRPQRLVSRCRDLVLVGLLDQEKGSRRAIRLPHGRSVLGALEAIVGSTPRLSAG